MSRFDPGRVKEGSRRLSAETPPGPTQLGSARRHGATSRNRESTSDLRRHSGAGVPSTPSGVVVPGSVPTALPFS